MVEKVLFIDGIVTGMVERVLIVDGTATLPCASAGAGAGISGNAA